MSAEFENLRTVTGTVDERITFVQLVEIYRARLKANTDFFASWVIQMGAL